MCDIYINYTYMKCIYGCMYVYIAPHKMYTGKKRARFIMKNPRRQFFH